VSGKEVEDSGVPLHPRSLSLSSVSVSSREPLVIGEGNLIHYPTYLRCPSTKVWLQRKSMDSGRRKAPMKIQASAMRGGHPKLK
jgi:hypothetical protein